MVFIATGIFLMLGSSSYPGFGNIFANTWAIGMSIKHLLVLVLAGLGTWLNMTLRRNEFLSAKSDKAKTGNLGNKKWILTAMKGSGAVVLLLNALASAQQALGDSKSAVHSLRQAVEINRRSASLLGTTFAQGSLGSEDGDMPVPALRSLGQYLP